MQRVLLTCFFAIFLPFCAFPRAPSAGRDDGLRKARALFQAGDYDKAISEYKTLTVSESHRRDAFLGLAQVRMARGEYEQAEEACRQVLRGAPGDPGALGLLGQVLQATGRYKLARQSFEKAVRQNPNQLEARLALGKMQWEWGEHEAARQTLQPFIAYYRNNANVTAEELNLIAQACVYLERFRDANELFYDATKADPKLWQAFVAWGELMLSKYNVADAQGIFQDALKINPHAAPAHLGLAKCLKSTDFEGAKQEAETALAINPGLVAAYDFLAELDILTGDLESALQELEKPLKVNANSLSTRTLRAVCYYFLHDLPKYHKEERTILAVNPRYADVYFEIAESLARRYLFQESVEFYNKALALNPEHWAAHAGLGTSLSRLGEEAAAKEELEKAFSRDPYNKYVGNLLTLFDEFPKYKTHKSTHFVLKVHERDDPVLGHYAFHLAEQCWNDLSAKYDLRGQKPFVLEVFPEHDDFAVRCFGLPGAQAFLGICFGNVVAMDSPRARTKGDFSWGETLWHEIVHVTHLRLSANRIPRWLAEGIAVYETTVARPYWQMNLDFPFILAFKNKRLLPLRDLDAGFNRPTNPGQVSLSYFQAAQVVEFIVEKYGREKLVSMFPKFRAGLKTPAVIDEVFGMDMDALDREFRDFIVQKYNLENVDFDFEPEQIAAHAEDVQTRLAQEVQEHPANPLLNLRFGLYYKREKEYEKAITYLGKAKELFPRYVDHDNPYRALAEIYLDMGQKEQAIQELAALTSLNGKDLEALRLLADLCIERKQFDCAIAALTKMLYVAPFEPAVHQKLGRAYLAAGRYDDAIGEFQVHLLTGPADLAGAHGDLAAAYLEAGRKAEAKQAALKALEIAPDYERAQEILLACIGQE